MNKKTLFDFIDLGEEVENAHLLRKRIRKDSKKAYWGRLAFIKRKGIEKIGVCQDCGEKNFIRWVDNEAYLCYDCYYEGMKQWGELYSYHGRRAEDIPGFMYDDEWEELWEKENSHIKEEVSDTIKASDFSNHCVWK